MSEINMLVLMGYVSNIDHGSVALLEILVIALGRFDFLRKSFFSFSFLKLWMALDTSSLLRFRVEGLKYFRVTDTIWVNLFSIILRENLVNKRNALGEGWVGECSIRTGSKVFTQR